MIKKIDSTPPPKGPHAATRARDFVRGWIVELVSLSEIAASSRRGRNQLRIAFGLGTVAAAGFCLAKLFDSAGWTFGIRFWTLAAIAIMMIRLAIWLFLKIEGGRE